MRHVVCPILVASFALAAGCAKKPPAPTTRPTLAQRAAATKPANPEAYLTLDQVEPRPVLPKPVTTGPATRPSLDAVELFAKARGAMLDNQRFNAINLLEKAVQLDAQSAELQYQLGRAYLGRGSSNESATKAFERAAELDPDNLEVQTQLGRQYLAKGDAARAIEHFRLALQTTEYKRDDDAAAVVDFFLARALQDKGYDRAALDQYAVLLRRLESPSLTIRGNNELAYLVNRPELLYAQIGELYERHGQYEEAHHAYEAAAARDAGNFDLQSRLVHTLLEMERPDDAARRAAEVVAHFRASAESLALMRDVYKQIGREDAVVAELRRLQREHPDDRALLFSLADLLRSDGRQSEAQSLLEESWRRSRADVEIVKRLFAVYDQRDDVEAASRLLVEALAANPDLLRELTPFWSDLLSPSRKNRLRVAAIQKLDVSPEAEAAKLFWISRIASLWNRDLLARNSLERAAKLSPPFAPAYRILQGEIWNRADWDEDQKIKAINELIARADREGNPALAGELRGLLWLNRKQPDRAVQEFAKAMKLGTPSPDLQFTYAAALRRQGNDARAEQLLWKLVGARPTSEDAYGALFRLHLDNSNPGEALKVLKAWLDADPQSTSARLLQASVFFQARQTDAAQQLLLELFKEDPSNVQVLGTMQTVYTDSGKLDDFVRLLEEERTQHPENRVAVEQLVEIYAEKKRLPEAMRVLDATRAAVADDADLLYYVSHLYQRIDQKQTAEEILQQIVDRIDPAHAPASNDLGYTWADQGRNLSRAEELIRVAVKSEPDNQSFLDSLGWVLYKRSKFDESRRHLEEAIGPASFPDPVVLDHLGDVLYRLGDNAAARKQWNRSMERLGQVNADARDDLKQLKLQLQQKLKQADAGQPVNVAPVAGVMDAKAIQAN